MSRRGELLVVIGLTLAFGLSAVHAQPGKIHRFKVDLDRDPRLLPYKIEHIRSEDWGVTRKVVERTLQVIKPATDSTSGLAIWAENPELNRDLPAQVTFVSLPEFVPVDDNPIPLTIWRLLPYFDTENRADAVIGGGYRNDSAFAFKVVLGMDAPSYCYLATGMDHTGNGAWEPFVRPLRVVDIDHDGHDEAIFQVWPQRDYEPRVLVCMDVTSMTIKWSLPLVPIVEQIYISGSGDNTSLLFSSYGSGHPVKSAHFDDNYSYLTRLDVDGSVLSNTIVGQIGSGTVLFGDENLSDFYLFHTALFRTDSTIEEHEPDGIFLSRLDFLGRPIQTVSVPTVIGSIWISDWDGDGDKEVFTLDRGQEIRIYEENLQLLAVGDVTGLEVVYAVLPPLAGSDSVMVLGGHGRGILITRNLSLVGLIPSATDYAGPAKVGADGTLSEFIASHRNTYYHGRFVRQGWIDYLAIIYYDYRYYILLLLTALAAGLISMNYYRSRVSSQNQQLEVAHQELAQTHEKLKATQQQLIEAEKYKQAKDIAGGFAHEIRNALFPAEASLLRMRRTLGDGIDQKQVERLAESSAKAVHRAISLTELISQYTRLDTSPDIEPTCVQTVVLEVLSANEERIRQQSVTVATRGTNHARVAIAQLHLYTILNNLVLNGLDALNGRPDPHILIVWEQDDSKIRITCTDNGSGIAEADRQRIFDPFFSTKPNTGTGLGLAIVKKIVTLYGGTAEACSEPGQGTTFSVVLAEWGESNNRS